MSIICPPEGPLDTSTTYCVYRYSYSYAYEKPSARRTYPIHTTADDAYVLRNCVPLLYVLGLASSDVHSAVVELIAAGIRLSQEIHQVLTERGTVNHAVVVRTPSDTGRQSTS